MILAWRGEVVNLSGRAVVMVNSCGSVVRSYKCSGDAKASWQERYFGMLNGDTEMAYLEAVGISGLPEVREQVFYIVRKDIIYAAQQIGRCMDDLLLPMRPFYREVPLEHSSSKKRARKNVQTKQELVGYQALMPAMFVFDPKAARRRYEATSMYNAQLG